MLKGLVLAACLFAEPAVAGECLHYGAIATLSGRYAPAVLAMPSAVGGDVREDAGRTADLLLLDAPLCMDADVISKSIPDSDSVQLRCQTAGMEHGSRLSLTGRLVGAHTGNGHTPVLLVCAS